MRDRRARLVCFIERRYRAAGVPQALWQPRIGAGPTSHVLFLHEITDAGLEAIVRGLIEEWRGRRSHIAERRAA